MAYEVACRPEEGPSYQESELPGSMHFDGEALEAILRRFRKDRPKRRPESSAGGDAEGGEQAGRGEGQGGVKRSKRQGDWQDLAGSQNTQPAR